MALFSLLISFMEFLVVWGAGAVQLRVAHPNSWNVLALFFGMLCCCFIRRSVEEVSLSR